MLGKRKRDHAPVASKDVIKQDREDIPSHRQSRDLFRTFFESSFDPIDEAPVRQSSASTTDGEDSDVSIEQATIHDVDSETEESDISEWSGFSEHVEAAPVVEVVDYGRPSQTLDDELDEKALHKSFMSSKPPRESQRPVRSKTSSTDKVEDDQEEATNLKYDLDLQRLLRESHLLEQTKTSSVPGKQRLRAIDMRLQDLGSKTSFYKQEKMPLSHAVGIKKKAASNEAQRRTQARENGIILEKPLRTSKTSSRRDRGVDAPALGKFRGGTLKLSRADVVSIQGSNGNKKKKGRR